MVELAGEVAPFLCSSDRIGCGSWDGVVERKRASGAEGLEESETVARTRWRRAESSGRIWHCMARGFRLCVWSSSRKPKRVGLLSLSRLGHLALEMDKL